MANAFHRVLGFVAVFAALSCSAQQIVTNPERDYVTSALVDNAQPPSDEVKRLELKLAEDAPPTVFLSYSKAASRSGSIWTVYVPVSGGYQRIDRTVDGALIEFRPDTVFAGKYPSLTDNGGLLVFYYGKGGAEIWIAMNF